MRFVKILFLSAILMPRVVVAQDQPASDFDPTVANPAYPAGAAGPRVLFDEGHFNMQTPSDSYAMLARLVENDGFDVDVNHSRLTQERLSGQDILVIVSPQPFPDSLVRQAAPVITATSWMNPALTNEEVDLVEAWVRGGGGLLLVTGHAPQAFWSASLAGRFGVDVHNSYAADSINSDRAAETFPRGAWVLFSRANGLLRPHPITEGRGPNERVHQIRGNGAASVSGPPGSVQFLSLGDRAYEWIYHYFNFRSGARFSVVSAGGRAQGVALSHGNGRVVVLTPSAMFFESYMSREGLDYRQLALNVMRWLSGLI